MCCAGCFPDRVVARLLQETAEALHRRTRARLRRGKLHFGHGTHNASDEAAYLVLHVLKLPPDTPLGAISAVPTARQIRRLDTLVGRRLAERVPVAYLTREAWLGPNRFYVDRRALVPRSYIAELLRDELVPWCVRPVKQALDLCTGSGCLAILMALAFPRARIDASDLSRQTLAVARRNVDEYRMKNRIHLVRSDLFRALPCKRYDLIVSNPPYVTESTMRTLPAEYRVEPVRALAGGADGLDLVRQIMARAAEYLAPKGLLVCEIGNNRRALERAYPEVPFLWPETSAGIGHVFILDRDDLPRGKPVFASR